MTPAFREHLSATLAAIDTAGLTKRERLLASPQGARVRLADGSSVLNFCANNYLGLANHPDILRAAHAALERWGFGLASVRFICGAQEIHRELETRLAAFLGTEDAILYGSCFDANGGVFETLLGPEDTIISDELNHASIIDGIRLCKARRLRYRNRDLADLEARLGEASAAGSRFTLVVTDGVFSMDGFIAPLREILDLTGRHGALLMVDDSHGVGVLGATGRGSPEHCGVTGRVDLLSGTLGKALGGASGGYLAGHRETVALLRQRSRPYLFSNSVPPVVVAAAIAALDLLARSTELRDRLHANTAFFRQGLAATGLRLLPGEHPIVPVMLGEATLAQSFATRLLALGVHAVGFSHPVVPHGAARIRVQVSAAHTREDLEFAIRAFADVKRELSL